MKRNAPHRRSNRTGPSNDDEFLPFFPSQWRYLKSLVMDDSINLETSKKIIDLLIAIQQRDTAEGRLGLAVTYEIYNAFYHLHKLDRNSNTEGAALQSVLACALQRSVNHLHDVYGHLERGPSPSYRVTMEYFSLPGVIASYRNDIAHGNYPSVDNMVDAIAEIRKAVINNYWKPFDGYGTTNPRAEGGKENLFADFTRKSRIFFQIHSRYPQTEEEEKSLSDMALKLINNDFHYFAESLYSTSFAIDDEDGFCFKCLPSPVPYYELDVRGRLPRFIAVIYQALKETGNMFYFCIHGFQSIENEKNRTIKKRKFEFFFICAQEIIKQGYWFSVNETIHLIKWEEEIKFPKLIFLEMPSCRSQKERIVGEFTKIYDELKFAEDNPEIDGDGVSGAKKNIDLKDGGKIRDMNSIGVTFQINNHIFYKQGNLNIYSVNLCLYNNSVIKGGPSTYYTKLTPLPFATIKDYMDRYQFNSIKVLPEETYKIIKNKSPTETHRNKTSLFKYLIPFIIFVITIFIISLLIYYCFVKRYKRLGNVAFYNTVHNPLNSTLQLSAYRPTI
uniref:HEPN_Swt1 domain-containing protein n=1 Tax=Strongyloides venezuelensis TaxID=75913 RepID=A0A0K0FSH3_STRVS